MTTRTRPAAAVLAVLGMLLGACERSPEPAPGPPDADGVPTHVPQLAPQVRALQQASGSGDDLDAAAQRQREAIDAATR